MRTYSEAKHYANRLQTSMAEGQPLLQVANPSTCRTSSFLVRDEDRALIAADVLDGAPSSRAKDMANTMAEHALMQQAVNALGAIKIVREEVAKKKEADAKRKAAMEEAARMRTEQETAEIGEIRKAIGPRMHFLNHSDLATYLHSKGLRMLMVEAPAASTVITDDGITFQSPGLKLVGF